MDKRFLGIVAVIILIFVGIAILGNHGSNNGGSNSNTPPTNHVEGDLTSKVTLVEYGDYECPVCESYYLTVQQVQQEYNSNVKFQFRNLPLSSIHPNAIAGARAAEAADLQGKFWQMHDMLYDSSNWNDWSTSSNPEPYFWDYAQQLGLNVTKFKSDFASTEVNNRIQADLAAFSKTGEEEATPTFFLNGKYVPNSELVDPTSGTPSVTEFSNVLNAALKSTGQSS
ncbi:MAG TPA: thioredoxin domain-containing protein [Verrucomicrobiae bacterium]|nr:thioredoxin domain-containing protein [Verrucomicrobiae bacterium]